MPKKLSDPNIISDTYWSILKCFLTGKKVPCIPTIFHENRFITILEKRLNYFTLFLLISVH